MQIALREGNGDAIFAQAGFDHETQIARHLPADSAGTDVDPVIHAKFQCIRAEVFQQDFRLVVLQRLAVAQHVFFQYLGHQPHVAAIGHAHFHALAHDIAAVGPVGDILFQKRGIRHQGFDTVDIAQHCGAYIHVHHRAAQAAHFHCIARLEGPLHQHHQPADQVFQQGLRAKTEADGDGAAEEGKCGQRNPHHRQRVQQQDDEYHRQRPAFGDADGYRRNPRACCQFGFNPVCEANAHGKAQCHQQYGNNDFTDRHAALDDDILAVDIHGFVDVEQLEVPAVHQRVAQLVCPVIGAHYNGFFAVFLGTFV